MGTKELPSTGATLAMFLCLACNIIIKKIVFSVFFYFVVLPVYSPIILLTKIYICALLACGNHGNDGGQSNPVNGATLATWSVISDFMSVIYNIYSFKWSILLSKLKINEFFMT